MKTLVDQCHKFTDNFGFNLPPPEIQNDKDVFNPSDFDQIDSTESFLGYEIPWENEDSTQELVSYALIWLDFETTKFYGEIVEFATVEHSSGIVFHQLINPKGKISTKNSEIHGFTKPLVENCLTGRKYSQNFMSG